MLPIRLFARFLGNHIQLIQEQVQFLLDAGGEIPPEENLAIAKKILNTTDRVLKIVDQLSDRQRVDRVRKSANDRAEKYFLNRVSSVVEMHLDDPQFSVEELCRETTMSYSQLHRKITACTGYSANRFIRHIRLSKAKCLLLETDLTIAEVALQTGFSQPSYFSKVFNKEFGITPSAYRALPSDRMPLYPRKNALVYFHI